MRTPSPFAGLFFDEGVKLAEKMGVERYESSEQKIKLKAKAASAIAEALGWLLESSPYDAATSRTIARDRLKEYRKH